MSLALVLQDHFGEWRLSRFGKELFIWFDDVIICAKPKAYGQGGDPSCCKIAPSQPMGGAPCVVRCFILVGVIVPVCQQ